MVTQRCVMVFALAMCACEGSHRDEPSPDATTPPGDGVEGGEIQVTVFDEFRPGFPAVGARVLFSAPTLLSHQVFTDASGIARGPAADGVVVTVIQSFGGSDKAFTHFIGLRSGDSVIAGPRRQEPPHAIGVVSVVMPELASGQFYTVGASCPTEGHVGSAQNIVNLTVMSPCASTTAATVVGRVHDATETEVLGVTVMDGVDLVAALGGTITMPPYAGPPQAISAHVTNVPSGVLSSTAFAGYRLGSDPTVLERQGTSSTETGTVDLNMLGYPVGDQSSIVVDMVYGPNDGFVDYHGHTPTRASHFELDASAIMRGLTIATATTDAITWMETASGSDPTLVTASLSWGNVSGHVYAPYTGTTLSLTGLPAELRPTIPPKIIELQVQRVDGASFEDIVPQIERDMQFPRLAFHLSYWRSSYPVDVLVL